MPHLDGPAASKDSLARRGLVGAIKVAVLAIQDGLREKLGLNPVGFKIKVYHVQVPRLL